MRKKALILFLTLAFNIVSNAQDTVSVSYMQKIYNEVKTPYKYGLVMTGADKNKVTDCPTIYRRGGRWYMHYFVFDGRGYETWLAISDNLLEWKTLGRLLSFSDSTDWDCNQKGGYLALTDTKWGGKYRYNKYDGKYWMSYFGSNSTGYESGDLAVGIAYTEEDPTKPHEWKRLHQPVLSPKDANARWWEKDKIYKNSIIEDKERLTGHRFVMYYNAKDAKTAPERIGMAVSDDMVNWQRLGNDPVLSHGTKGTITGDAYLQKIGDLWVMFYFGAFYNKNPKILAWNTFACSHDLLHWTDWQGEPLVQASEDYDERYAHKSCLVKWKGVVYHFYCAVDNNKNRGIALATSKDLGKSDKKYPTE